MQKLNLCLHTGAATVAREAIAQVPVPAPTETWFPINHEAFVGQCESALSAAGMVIVDQQHALTRGGARYFGLMQIECPSQPADKDFSYVLGLRNSMDKSFPAGMVVGTSVFVCDNMSFSGEIRVFRKHTLNILRDLPGLTGRAVGMLAEKWTEQSKRINIYKNTPIGDARAHDVMIRSLDVGAATPQQIPRILQEWRNPRHAEFSRDNVWSLLNAFTEVGKESSLVMLPKRTTALHMLLDNECGIWRRTEADILAGTTDATVELN